MNDFSESIEKLSSRKRALFKMLMEEAKKGQSPAGAQTIHRRQNPDPAPLSFAQQRLWLLDKLDPNSPVYNLAGSFRLKGLLDVGALQQSLDEIIRRHEILRTTFPSVGGQPAQIIGDEFFLALSLLNVTTLPENEREDAAYNLAREQARSPFDLSKGPLLRATLVQLGLEDHLFVINLHHIISDGWSMSILIREMAELYEAFRNGKPSPLPELPIQYADFASWQQQYLQGEVLEAELSYWKEHLSDAPAMLELPTDRPRPPIQTRRGSFQARMLPKTLTDSLKSIPHEEGATFFMVMLTAFKILLYRYTNQPDIVVGFPLANRKRVETHGLIGFFVNTLALRTDLSDNPTYSEALRKIRDAALGAYAHQDLPFERLVEELRPERDVSRPPIFQVMFVMHNNDAPATDLKGLTLVPVTLHKGAVDFDLVLNTEETAQGLSLILEYNSDLFEAATAARMLAHFEKLLEAIAANPAERIARLPMLLDAEREQMITAWNGPRTDYAKAKCIHELIEAQAARTPDMTAVVFEGERPTYREINSRANQLAWCLIDLGVGPEVCVAICVERSIEMVVAILGVLKAGGAFVPLDPAYPNEQLEYRLRDAKPPVLLTQQRVADMFNDRDFQVVMMDDDWKAIARSSTNNPAVNVMPDNLAYVIYTSGTTGRPKGVMVSHQNLIHSTRARASYYNDPVQSFLLLSPSTFDSSMAGIFWTLLQGGSLHLPARHHERDTAQLARTIAESEISHMLCLPSLYTLLLERATAQEMESLRAVIVAGESCPSSLIKAHSELLHQASLFNEYGPTEGTVWSSVYACHADDGRTQVPIGRPIDNVEIYILDEFLQLVPTGVAGELYIGGDGLARGYLEQCDLTSEKFLPDPYSKEPGRRLYRTGDLARHLPDGNIEFLGRRDHQVKVRGYRIELGEIEAALLSHTAVREAAVINREDIPDDKRLAAYIVTNSAQPPAEGELRDFLSKKLPFFMMPSALVFLDALPLTPNGKLNRRALPVPDYQQRKSGVVFEAPRTRIEQEIAGLWRQMLNLEEVGLHDNFFDLGGHSLLLIKLQGKLLEIFGKEIPAIELFRHTTISSLAKYIGNGPGQGSEQEERKYRGETSEIPGRPDNRAIAIVGMAGRFPGAKNVDEFWQNLKNGVESISSFSEEDLITSGLPPAVIRSSNFVNAGAVLDDIDMFDASFFGFNPKEAEVMDPQHRFFLECAWEALEHAGYDPEKYRGHIGVYAGVSMSSYSFNLYSSRQVRQGIWNYQALLGNDKDFLATRVSYKLNLRGPSMTIQTACSTSLVAVHLACKSLIDRECDMALAGGVTISVQQRMGYFNEEGGIRSPDGHCRAFDADARGTVFGSGVGLIVLKRLADALAYGDNILAVIKGSAINNDGASKIGYTAPSINGQAEVIAEAQARAGIHPETVGYIEAHGTGTEMGDPIEVAALKQAFRAKTDKNNFCAIGSVKTNVGHLDAAAGIVGIIKTVLALQNEMLPPSLHFQRPNPNIDFNDSPFYVNTQLRDWGRGESPRRAGVSSFGIGGTNAHLILEEAPAITGTKNREGSHLLVLSARTRSALDTATANLIEHLKRHPSINLADAAFTLQVGRRAFKYRRALVCSDVDDAIAKLTALNPNSVLTGSKEPAHSPVAFMFPGQGAQYVRMGIGLYANEPRFREEVDACCELLKPHLGLDLRKILYAAKAQTDEVAVELKQTRFAQPALFVTEYALARLWMRYGIQPKAMIGHSIGEYVAACLAGAFSLENALSIVAARGRLMQGLPQGAMLAVSLTENQARVWVNEHISLAATNAPSNCVMSGTIEAVDELERRLKESRVGCRRLHTSHAFHSPMVDPVLKPFAEELRRVKLNRPQIPYISNVTGTWVKEGEATDPEYWAKHLRQTVRFADGVGELLKIPGVILLEIGPGHALSTLASQQGKQTGSLILNSMRHPEDQESDESVTLKTLARLWLEGVELNWSDIYENQRRHRVPLPLYPFERKRYWIGQLDQSLPVSSAQQISENEPDRHGWLYIPSWKRSISERAGKSAQLARRRKSWLVFIDECGLGGKIVQRLTEQGQVVMAVLAGDRFGKSGDGVYTIDPRSRDHYAALIKELLAFNQAPEVIVHLWNFTTSDQTGQAIDCFVRSQDLGLNSILFIVQALSANKLAALPGTDNNANRIEVAVITNNMLAVTGDETLCPEKATALGICKVIPQEYSNITCRSIDVADFDTETRRGRKLVDDLLAELDRQSPEPVVAYRGEHRWMKSFEPLRGSDQTEGHELLREDGVYIITAGLEGGCFELVRYMAQTVRSKLAIILYSPFLDQDRPEQARKIKSEHTNLSRELGMLNLLYELGPNTMVMSANTGDYKQMQRAVARITKQFGQINGVIQAIGIDDGGLIEAKMPDAMAAAMSAKVKGALVLNKLFKDVKLDFILLCSSIDSVLGRAGKVDSCAADAFLEAFAHKSSASGNLTITINWDACLNGGSAVTAKAKSFDTAFRGFICALSSAFPQAIVSDRELHNLLKQENGLAESIALEQSEESHADKPAHARPEISNSYVAPRNEAERKVAETWQRLLNIEQVGINDNFFELGGHSLLAIDLMSALREAFGVELRMASLFEAPTVAGLAESIEKISGGDARQNAPVIVPVNRDAYRAKS